MSNNPYDEKDKFKCLSPSFLFTCFFILGMVFLISSRYSREIEHASPEKLEIIKRIQLLEEEKEQLLFEMKQQLNNEKNTKGESYEQ